LPAPPAELTAAAGRRTEGDISRILFMQQFILTACYHTVLCDLPSASNGPFSRGCLLGLAPGGVCRAACFTAKRGELLPRLFTLTLSGGIFSVALSIASRRPGVTRHPALWCSDFPHRLQNLQAALLLGSLRLHAIKGRIIWQENIRQCRPNIMIAVK
jgi:hypothetical protein